MNSRTKEDLVEFINQVERLTQSVLHVIGMETAQQIVQAAENLKGSLHHDETIVEPK